MFKNIKIKNFRGIKELEIDDFKQVNLFVGGNNSGKTSVLEALYVALKSDLLDMDILVRGSEKLRKQLRNEDFYHDSLRDLMKSIFYLSKEKMSKNSKTQIELTDSKDKKNTIQITKIYANELSKWANIHVTSDFSQGNDLEGVLLENVVYQVGNLIYIGKEDGKTCLISQPRFKGGLDCFVSYLDSTAGTVIDAHIVRIFGKINVAGFKAQIIEFLQIFDDSVEDIQYDPKGFYIKSKSLKNLVRLESFGEGIIKAFIYSCYLLNSEMEDFKLKIILIDEIENGLHYESQNKLWKWLLKVCKDKNIQIFATTHSEDCVRAFVEASKKTYKKDAENESILYRLEKKSNDQMKAVPIEIPVLEVTLEDNGEFR